MTLTLDDNESFEAFQFWWYALTFSKRGEKSPARLLVEEKLRQKFASLSEQAPDGIGRTLREPCAVLLSADERVVLLEEMVNCEWREDVKPHVGNALRVLGCQTKLV